MDPYSHIVYSKFWSYHPNVTVEIETHQTRKHFYNLLLYNFYDPPFFLLIWEEWHPLKFSTAVAHLIQGITCCAFRDALTYISIAKCDPVWPFSSNSFKQKVISVHRFATHRTFSFIFLPFSVIPRINNFLILKYTDLYVWHQQSCQIQSHFSSPY